MEYLGIGVFRSMACGVVCLFAANGVLASGDEGSLGDSSTLDPAPCSVSSQVAFVSDAGGSADLWIFDRSTGVGRRLLNWPDSQERDPDWSPACDRIVFSSTRGAEEGGFQLWSIAADGSDALQLTTGAPRRVFPRWSPDGNNILYSSDAGGKYGLWVMARDGTDQRPIFQNKGASLVHGSWSPTGDSVAFVACSVGAGTGVSCQVYSLIIGSDAARQLTSSDGVKLFTDWGPAGILFSAPVNGQVLSWVVDDSGSDVKQITSPLVGEGSDFQPRWDRYKDGVMFIRVESGRDSVWVQSPAKVPVKMTSVSALPALSGDINFDGCVDTLDYNILLGSVRNAGAPDLAYDLNGDGRVTLADVRTLIGLYTNPGGARCR